MQSIKPNILSKPFFIFLVIYSFMYIFSVLPTNDEDTIMMRGAINAYGIICHFLSVLSFMLGCYFASVSWSKRSTTKTVFTLCRFKFNVLIFLYCATCIAILLWQIGVSSSLSDYWNRLAASIVLNSADPNARNYVLLSHEDGGLSGIIKMFSFLPLSALFMVLSAKIVRNKENESTAAVKDPDFIWNIFIIFIVVLVRSALALDRGVLFYFILIILYYYMFSVYSLTKSIFIILKNPLSYILSFIVIVFINIVSGVRQGIGLIDTLTKYFSLGLANLSIMFDSEFDYTFGFGVFNVIVFPFKFFGLTHMLPEFKEADFVWNVARYLTAYAYQDFGILFVLFFFLFGYIATFVFCRAWYNLNLYYLVILFPIIMAIIGSFSIPPFRGPEWWVSLFMALIGIKLSYKRQYVQ